MAEVELADLPNKPFSHLDISVQETILARKIIFQGETTTLRDLLTPTRSVDFDEIIDSDLLSMFKNNETVSVGSAVNQLDEELQCCYVQRNFYHGEDEITEEKMCEYKEGRWHQIITIMNPPGSGKSTVLNNIAATFKKNYPNLWVIKIDLNDYSEGLSTLKEKEMKLITTVDLLNSREESRIKDGLEQKIFNIPGKVVLIIDGIDEVSFDYNDIIEDFMSDYHKNRRLARVYVAASNNMDESLRSRLWSRSRLIGFSEDNQIVLLKKHLEKGNQETNDDKSKLNAEKLIRQEWLLEDDNAPVGIPLQIKMLAKVLCKIDRFDETSLEWKSYHEFLSLGNIESEPEKVNLLRLYLLYIHKSCCQNETQLNEDMLREDIAKLNEKYQYSLYITALENILSKQHCELFNCYKNRALEKSGELLTLNIVKKVGDRLRFTHRTVAEYFLADCIANELRHTENKEFLTFLVEDILTRHEFRLVRLFLNNLMGTVWNSISNNTLKDIGYIMMENDNTFLHYLLREDNIETFYLIFKCLKLAGLRLDFDIVRLNGETLLQTAISAGQFGVMEFLVEQGASVNSKDNNESTALFNAVSRDNLRAVKFLIEHGAEVHCKDMAGRTPLHKAAASSSLDMVEYLLSQGAVVDSRDRQGRTPLQEAAKSGNLNKVEYLVKKDAAVTGKLLYDAVCEGHLNVVQYLLENGADITITNTNLLRNTKEPDKKPNENTVEILKLLIEHGADVNAVGRNGVTVLQSYIDSNDNVDIIKFLVENGADIKRVSKGESALSRAIRRGAIKIIKYLVENNATLENYHNFSAIDKGHLDIVRYLTAKGMELNFRTKQTYSTLCTAVIKNDIDTVKFFMEKGVDINAQIIGGPILEVAICNNSSFDTVKFLVENGASIEGSLKEACRKGDLPLVQYLMQKGANEKGIFKIDKNLELLQYLIEKGVKLDMRSILHESAIEGDLNIARCLIDNGVNVSIDEYGWYTPLLQAAKYDHLHIVNLLLRSGARINDTDWKKETALNKAIRHDNLEIAEFLVQKGADVKKVIGEDRKALAYYSLRYVFFILDYIESVNVDKRPDSFVFATWLNRGAFSSAEYLAKKSVGVCRSVVDVVNNITEKGDSELLGLIFQDSITVEYLLEQGLQMGVNEFHKYDVLLSAASRNDLKFVKHLVEKGVDINRKDEKGCTPLHKASDFRIVKYLVGRGADVNAETNDGWSVLHEAIENRIFDICRFLVESGANVNKEDLSGRTVLYVAAARGSYSKLTYLLEKGAKFTKQENSKVLHEVVRFKDLDLLKCLVENGADVEGRDAQGRTVLFKAVESGDLEIVKYLVESGGNVKASDDKSICLYHYASQKSNPDILRYLKSVGARQRTKNK